MAKRWVMRIAAGFLALSLVTAAVYWYRTKAKIAGHHKKSRGKVAKGSSKLSPAAAALTGVAPTTGQEAMLQGAVASHESQTRACYDKAVAANPDLEGKVTLRLRVDGKGKLLGAAVESSTLDSPSVERCIADAARDWHFPAVGSAAPVVLSYVFDFTREKQAQAAIELK